MATAARSRHAGMPARASAPDGAGPASSRKPCARRAAMQYPARRTRAGRGGAGHAWRWMQRCAAPGRNVAAGVKMRSRSRPASLGLPARTSSSTCARGARRALSAYVVSGCPPQPVGSRTCMRRRALRACRQTAGRPDLAGRPAGKHACGQGRMAAPPQNVLHGTVWEAPAAPAARGWVRARGAGGAPRACRRGQPSR